MRIAHLSDVHFGKIAHPAVVGALIDEVNTTDVDLVAVSGDLTQRARRREFAAAREMLDAFTPPVIVVPGNHDVRAWWHNPFERVWRSTDRFRALITDERVPTFSSGGVVAVGINSAHGLTVKGGRVRPEALAEMEARFGEAPADAFRVLVVHHHLVRLEALGEHDVSRGAHVALDAARRSHVDLILCGHLHRSHVAPIEIAPKSAADPDGHTLVVASAGTATSSRGRGDNAGANLYNWVTVGPDTFTVAERRFDAAAGRFGEGRETLFARNKPGLPAPEAPLATDAG
jgi:3',5'-cyclic AMP phosphodiesterase CpdA